MKRIGILAVRTLNYGSLLQSYATQEIVKDLGYDCDIILYKKTNMVKQGLRLLDKDVRNNTLRSFQKKIYIKTHGKELVYCIFAIYFIWMTTTYASQFYGTVPFEFFWE